MEKTTLGLTRLAPGESLSTDNFSFQDLNPKITNSILEYAAFKHRHDGHAPLGPPVEPPLVAVDIAGGTIPSDTTIYVGYTILDADGGETTLNPDPEVITTQGGLDTPIDGPTATAFVNAGTLVAGKYTYAITVTDGLGGETAIGPGVTVTIPPGSGTNRIELSGLTALVADSNGSGYRLWRRVNGSPWGLLASGAANVVNDDGSLCADCSNQSPPLRTGKTNATNRLRVTVPNAAPNGTAAQFAIYASLNGTFSNPSLLGVYPIADLGAQKIYTSLSFVDGSPPEVSQTLAGAPKINADNEVINLRVKAPVANAAALPANGNRDGDLRVTLDDHHLHVWDQALNGWGDLATGGVGGAHTIQDEGVPLTQRANLNFVGDGVVVTDTAGVTTVTIAGVAGPPGAAGGLNWAGVWNPATDYALKDLVRTTVAGIDRLWAAVANPAVGDDPANGAPWELVLEENAAGGSGAFSRANLAVVAAASGNFDPALPRGYRLLKLAADAATRVRLYTRADKRLADVARAVDVPPAGAYHGVILDVELDAATPLALTPAIDGWNDDDVVADVGYVRVDGAATVTLTYVKTEV